MNDHDDQIRKWYYSKKNHKQNTNQHIPCSLYALNKNVLMQDCLNKNAAYIYCLKKVYIKYNY